jgi:chemotaxis response regulator CheB
MYWELAMTDLAKEIQRIGSIAVKEAQRKSMENGVANVYSKNGQLYYQLSDGTYTYEMQENYKKLMEKNK